MTHLNLVCLSLTTNLRCFGFTLGECAILLIPPTVEVTVSLFFIYLHSGPGRLAQALLATDAFLYFIWTLLDMLSRVLPAARGSLSTFKVLDSLVGAVSFTPILFYSIYLYRMSFRDFIPTVHRKLQPFLEISLPILLIMAVAVSEVSSFLGFHLELAPGTLQVAVGFPHNNEYLWQSVSRSSLATYATVQFLFLLLALFRLFTAYLDQRRIEITHSDEHHYFNGIAWITGGITLGIAETALGFVTVSFGVALARRALRLVARGILMYGFLKGLDVAENFENLEDELRGKSRIKKHISSFLGVTPRRNMFRRISQTSPSEALQMAGSSADKRRGPRVTAHYEEGLPPFLQIRFSQLDLPGRTFSGDPGRQRQGSTSGDKNVPDKMTPARNTTLETPRAKSALAQSVNCDDDVTPDQIRPPEKSRTKQESGGTAPDNLSIVRDLERKFPSIPPRVTGQYRGSILGENYEDDLFPVAGVSRQSSLRQDGTGHNPSDEGGAPVTLSPSGSMKRKPAPPLLENIAHLSDTRRRPTSTWGGLTQNAHPVGSPAATDNTWEGTTVCSPNSTLDGEPTSSGPRKMTARDAVKRASPAWSDGSVHSAEWFASASSSRPARITTAADIEMYRKGTLGPGSVQPVDDGLLPSEGPLEMGGEFADDVMASISHLNIGQAI